MKSLERELFLAHHLVAWETIEHVSTELARNRMTERLACRGGDLEGVLMVDADQAFEAAPDVRASVVDQVVEQYLEGPALRMLFGVTPIGYEQADDATNFRRGEDGSITWCGSGFLFIPSAAWAATCAAHPNPWFPDASSSHYGQGEDVRMVMRARAAGVELEPIRGLRMWHDPLWRKPLFHEEP